MVKIESIETEINDYYSNDDIYSFNTWGADLSFRELIARYKDDELLKPELQRKYVWDKVEASRFIDSILLGLPIPSIFLAQQDNETLLIIDGYQRLMTVYDYVTGVFSKDNSVFKLSNSPRINARWRGKAFVELGDKEKRRIRNTTIHAIIFVQTEPSENSTGMYQVFERINTTGKTLSSQEIRNCVYQGSFNDFLFDVNKTPSWRMLFGSSRVDSRMRDMEFILRFLYLKNINIDELDVRAISLKKELNLFMGRAINNTSKTLDFFRAQFINTCDMTFSMFGVSAFLNLSRTKPDTLARKFNPTIFDSIMMSVSNHNGSSKRIDWESRRRKLLQDEEYQDVIRFRTTDIERIQRRIQLVDEYIFKK